MALFFCSVGCWDAHVPTLRHRDAWAEEATAPSREEAAQEREVDDDNRPAGSSTVSSGSSAEAKAVAQPVRRLVGATSSEPPTEREVLVVMSKLKQHIRSRSGMNTSDAVSAVLSDYLRVLCEGAIDHARAAGRKTVMDRDFEATIDAARAKSDQR